ncbi:histidinol dehydrogenase [Longivirga aurantiaca]|uniref:Histidinol dehydrogenase n=1 Tax=Longivirga aurantiaca TaxID=1837743 RepID=A0ABW1SVN3_9ACTN
MLSHLDLRSQAASGRSASLPGLRGHGGRLIASEETAAIVEHVRAGGPGAMRWGSGQLGPSDTRYQALDPDLAARALASLPSPTQARMEGLADRIRSDCLLAAGREREHELSPGVRVVHRRVAVDRVGLYLPSGGSTIGAVSSLLWYAFCARAAGVRSVAVAIDPRSPESMHQLVMAACHIAGAHEVYSVGGAEAIALLAYGSGGCDPVDLIAGPDDQESREAKSLVSPDVDVLHVARTRAFAILADRWANPNLVAADIVDVAEGRSWRDVFLVTPGEGFAEDVVVAVQARLRLGQTHADHGEAARDPLGTVALVDDMEHALAVVDTCAPMDVAIHSAYAWSYAARIRRAETVYVGAHSPFALRSLGLTRPLVSTTPQGTSRREVSPGDFLRDARVVHCTRQGLESLSDECESAAHADSATPTSAAVAARWETSIAHSRTHDRGR